MCYYIGAPLAESDLKGVVLDLRNNPGGVLGASVDMAGLRIFMVLLRLSDRRKVTPDGPLREDNLFF